MEGRILIREFFCMCRFPGQDGKWYKEIDVNIVGNLTCWDVVKVWKCVMDLMKNI
jgi:hypothetical protein